MFDQAVWDLRGIVSDIEAVIQSNLLSSDEYREC